VPVAEENIQRVAPELVVPWYQRPGIWLRVALAVTFLVYLRTITFDFVFDDHLQIALNPWLDSWRQVPAYFTHQLWAFMDYHAQANFYRPVFMVWFAAVKHLLGGSPGWYHLATILLHLVVVTEAFVFARLLLRDDGAAAITAAIFALHPAKVEDVAWIAGGGEPLFAAFFFATFICYWNARRSERRRLAWTIAALFWFLLALFSKEQAIVGPAILAAYEFWDRRDRPFGERIGKTIVAVLPFAAASGVYWGVRYHVMHGVTEVANRISVPKTLWTQPLAWTWYLRHLAFPFHLSVFYPDLIARQFSVRLVLLPALALVAIAAVVWHFARRSAEGVLLVAWFMLTMAPPVAMVLMVQPHDRYLYLPSFAASAGLAMAIRKYIASRPMQLGLTAAICTVFAIATFLGTAQWDNDVSLMERAVNSAPERTDVRVMLGVSYLQQGDEQRGMETLREAARRDPKSLEAWQGLAIHEYTIGEFDAAYSDFQHALAAALPGQEGLILYNMGLVSLRLNRVAEAEEWARKAIAADPKAPGYHRSLAAILDAEGRRGEAEQERRTAATVRK